jgi:hypothetical protein
MTVYHHFQQYFNYIKVFSGVCQGLNTGRWCSLDSPISFLKYISEARSCLSVLLVGETRVPRENLNIIEILLKVMINSHIDITPINITLLGVIVNNVL